MLNSGTDPDRLMRLRRIEVWLEDKQDTIEFVTNHLKLAASTIAAIYRDGWQIEHLQAVGYAHNVIADAPVRNGANVRRLWPTICIALLAATTAAADDEASNRTHIRTDQWGHCFAKSVPSEYYGSKGTTKIYSVRPGDDTLLHTFDWYASEIYLNCVVGRADDQLGVSVVRLGSWARGPRATADQMAIAFYFRGVLVRQYSTLEIAGSPENVSRSVSHYTVIRRIDGYHEQRGNFSTFEVLTTDGRMVTFDPTTGAILSTRKPTP